MEDALQPLSQQDVARLLDVLQQDLPDSTVVHNWLRTQLAWSVRESRLRVHVLCPRGEWRRGTVVAFADGLALANKKYGVVYARPRHDAELAAALTSTRAVPWRDMYHLSGVLERHIPIVRAAAAAAGVSLPAKQPPLSVLLYCPASLANEKDVIRAPEENVRVCRLEGRHLDEVWRLRPLFPDFYKPVIRACLEYNECAGVFKTLADGSEQLVSMAIQAEYGGMGMAQTHPDHLGRGYSNMAGQKVVKTLADRGVDIHAWTALDNHVVLKFSENRGMQVVGKAARVIISPDVATVRGRL